MPNFVAAKSFEACYAPGARFVYFGRLSREKGVHALIEATTQAGVGVDVIGRGPAEAEVRALARERDVRFLGYLTGAKLNAAVSAARMSAASPS